MKHVEVYDKGEDNGWLHKQNFWFDPDHEHGFGIVDLDSIYPEKYFEHDHVKPETVEAYCRLVPEIYESLTGRQPESLIEFGSAGGWFLAEFIKRGYFCLGLEGTKAGIDACFRRGIIDNQILQHDFRRPIDMSGAKGPSGHRLGYQIALCTEVAEHIEPPFSSVLVKSLVDAAPFIWFSFEEPNTNPAHIHHPNEMPAKFWINLFDFYGYKAYKLPQWVYDQTEGRGSYVFYDQRVFNFDDK
jgi:hypothetical protein